MTKVLPEKEKAEKIVASLAGTAFDFYFDRSAVDNGSTDESKDYGKVEGVIMEKFSVQRTASKIMKESISLECDAGISEISSPEPISYIHKQNSTIKQSLDSYEMLRNRIRCYCSLWSSEELNATMGSSKYVPNTPTTVK